MIIIMIISSCCTAVIHIGNPVYFLLPQFLDSPSGLVQWTYTDTEGYLKEVGYMYSGAPSGTAELVKIVGALTWLHYLTHSQQGIFDSQTIHLQIINLQTMHYP